MVVISNTSRFPSKPVCNPELSRLQQRELPRNRLGLSSKLMVGMEMSPQMGQVGRMEHVVHLGFRVTSISPKAVQGEMDTLVFAAKTAERGLEVRVEVTLFWTYLALLQSCIFLVPVQL